MHPLLPAASSLSPDRRVCVPRAFSHRALGYRVLPVCVTDSSSRIDTCYMSLCEGRDCLCIPSTQARAWHSAGAQEVAGIHKGLEWMSQPLQSHLWWGASDWSPGCPGSFPTRLPALPVGNLPTCHGPAEIPFPIFYGCRVGRRPSPCRQGGLILGMLLAGATGAEEGPSVRTQPAQLENWGGMGSQGCTAWP